MYFSCSGRKLWYMKPVVARDFDQMMEELPNLEVPLVEAAAISKAKLGKWDHIIVLDDDPTGTQTVYGIPVLTGWSLQEISAEMDCGTPLFFILTNSRSLDPWAAEQVAFEIGQHIRQASQEKGKKCFVISRSDSTLRGHYPLELDTLELGLGLKSAVHFLIPAFFEGGRFTIDDVHYVRTGSQLVPVSQTPYARDPAFGFHYSNLKWWVEEKNNGYVKAAEVVSFSLKELRTQRLEQLIAKVNGLESGQICIVNAVNYQDLSRFCLALLAADITPLCRSAASFVAALAAQAPRPHLKAADLLVPGAKGMLMIVGSYVPTTSRQLTHLLPYFTGLPLELDVREWLNHPEEHLVEEYARNISDALMGGEDVLVYTSRELIASHDPEKSLNIGQRISAFLYAIVQRLQVSPSCVLAKGGITSSDIATIGLGVKRAMVLGQVRPGIPVWRLGVESKYPGLSYIIFPGNVGSENTLTEVWQELRWKG